MSIKLRVKTGIHVEKMADGSLRRYRQGQVFVSPRGDLRDTFKNKFELVGGLEELEPVDGESVASVPGIAIPPTDRPKEVEIEEEEVLTGADVTELFPKAQDNGLTVEKINGQGYFLKEGENFINVEGYADPKTTKQAIAEFVRGRAEMITEPEGTPEE